MAGNDALHNQIAQALATAATTVVGGTASVSTMRGSSAGPKANLPPVPYTVVGPPSGRQIPASSEEQLFIRYPMRCYVGKIRDGVQTQHDINEFLDAFLITFRNLGGLGISISGQVTDVHIESWDTDKFYEVGGEAYQAIDFTVVAEVERTATYTA